MIQHGRENMRTKGEEYAKAQHPMPGTPIVDSKTAINNLGTMIIVAYARGAAG